MKTMRHPGRTRLIILALLLVPPVLMPPETMGRSFMDNMSAVYPLVRDLTASFPPARSIVMARIEEVFVPGPGRSVRVRIYTPPVVRENAPLVLYLHGGGFVIGSFTTTDRTTRIMARDGQCVVASADYALAPEYPYPAGLEDCEAVFEWLALHAAAFSSSPRRIVVAGDSAGANLSAALCLKRRDARKLPPLAQILFSPPVGSIDPVTGRMWPSYAENADRSVLTPKCMNFFIRSYLGDPAAREHDPYVHPLVVASFSGLPPALIMTCGLDPLRDEGEAYAARLKAAGVPVTARRFEDQDHVYVGPDAMELVKNFLGSL
jgi:acetyl esterase